MCNRPDQSDYMRYQPIHAKIYAFLLGILDQGAQLTIGITLLPHWHDIVLKTDLKVLFRLDCRLLSQKLDWSVIMGKRKSSSVSIFAYPGRQDNSPTRSPTRTIKRS
jgi:hypothetical protein